MITLRQLGGAAALLLGLATAASAQTTFTGTIVSGGLTRDYRVYVPASYSSAKAVPLLFNLHGYGSNNLEQEVYGDFRPVADTANFIVVHPNGTTDAGGNRFWNVFTAPGTGGVDDVAFLSELLTSLQARYSIDPDRVYSTGMSNGGFMSYELACKLSNRVAAIGSVTGSMVQSRLSACTPQHPVPIIEIHGTADNTVPYNGNPLFLSVPTVVEYWARVNGCTLTPTITAVPNTNTADGSTAERYVYAGGRNGSVVEHYRVVGGGHTWPGAPVTIGITNRDFSASAVVWRFLRRYRLSQLSLPLSAAKKATASQLTVYPNPVTDIVTVRASGGLRPEQLSATDVLGQAVPVHASLAPDGALQVATSHWRSGVYTLRVAGEQGNSYQKLIKP